ncbi:MAG TPA: RDD family protein [Solirubrobacteraceae bacterium]|nr:RDD family protein [Solirubrobacteraceae bacterium]
MTGTRQSSPSPGGNAAAAHAIAETRAQDAAARRVHVLTGETDHAVPDYTGLVTRAIGFGIDALIIDLAAVVVIAIVALALNLFHIPSEVDTALAAIGALVFVVWAGAYFVTFWSTTGQTPGARIMRFRVLAPGAQRGRIGPRRALVRLIAMVLAAIPLLAGYLMVLYDDRRRGLHDRIARTVVVDAPDTETPVRRARAGSGANGRQPAAGERRVAGGSAGSAR